MLLRCSADVAKSCCWCCMYWLSTLDQVHMAASIYYFTSYSWTLHSDLCICGLISFTCCWFIVVYVPAFTIHGCHLYFFAVVRPMESVPNCYRPAYRVFLYTVDTDTVYIIYTEYHYPSTIWCYYTKSLPEIRASFNMVVIRFVHYFNLVPALSRSSWLMVSGMMFCFSILSLLV